MPQVIYADSGDEVADLVERVRSAPQTDIAVVLPDGLRASQIPVNLRLLSQVGRSLGKKVSVISGEARVQELAKAAGFPTYASVPAFERGIETVRPHAQFVTSAPAATAGAAANEAAGGVAVAAPPVPPVARTAVPSGSPPLRGGIPGGPQGEKPDHRRRNLGLGALGLVALIVFMLFGSTAKVTITLAGTRLTVKPEIHGSTAPNSSNAPDQLQTTLLTSSKTQSFQANPSGQKQVAGTAATGVEHFDGTNLPQEIHGTIWQGVPFQTADQTITFEASENTNICIGPNPGQCPSDYPPNGDVPIVDSTPEAKGNLPAGTITYLANTYNPCYGSSGASNGCGPSDISVTNSATTGGTDPSTEVVASEDDVANWTQQVQTIESQMKSQATSDMKKQIGNGKTLALDANGNGINITAEVNPPLPKAGDPFTATNVVVTTHATAAAYNNADLQKILQADLQAQVAQGEQLAASSIQVSNLYVNSVGTDGSLDMNVEAVGYGQPSVDLEALKGQLAGKTPGDVQRMVRGKIDHVVSVDVSQSIPFFWLPLFSSRIEIDENFVQQQ